MIRRLQLLLKELEPGEAGFGPAVRENFRRIADLFRDDPLLKSEFVFLTATLSAPTYPATVNLRHRLSFVPKDVIMTSLVGGTLTWIYENFNADYLYATISAETTFRAFVGTHAEGRTV